jgi:hypothetical protein
MTSINITNTKKRTKADDGIPLIKNVFIKKENYHFTINILARKAILTVQAHKFSDFT